ncbi:hypothetical protein [Actinoallomurus acaciae]|uniref:Fido domain-containing protein n=1 Tax=Actinoallomurus acaciae TaxID=502577 RepID=A0ABV5YHY1_9ACTN
MTEDALDTWLRLRSEVPWTEPGDVRTPVAGRRDGAEHHIRTVEAERSRARAAGLLAALRASRRDAAARRRLDFALMSEWQRQVLQVPEAPYRVTDAYAKQGRERYGPRPLEEFNACLAECEPGPVPLPSRAARAYLDVCFFHPFGDGNARAALLTLLFVLAREQVMLDHLGPLPALVRHADDPDTGPQLVRLLHILIRQTAAPRRP